ncbi:hypothetical protein [Erythrobacter donghaensis]|uniref:hypothetical protein n=1 Tax=Erythrobacter donghaensis TaxID=267135 RepID=UPI00117DE65F|nr:hypothetical protein [Erythrobacter donghaensis]
MEAVTLVGERVLRQLGLVLGCILCLTGCSSSVAPYYLDCSISQIGRHQDGSLIEKEFSEKFFIDEDGLVSRSENGFNWTKCLGDCSSKLSEDYLKINTSYTYESLGNLVQSDSSIRINLDKLSLSGSASIDFIEAEGNSLVYRGTLSGACTRKLASPGKNHPT